MSFLGKVYNHESDENFEDFTKTLNIPGDGAALMADFKPSLKLDKDGDTYTFSIIHPLLKKDIQFESGVAFDEKLMDTLDVSTTITVDGNVVTQVQSMGDQSLTYVKEYSDDKLVETITSTFWDGTAVRNYTAE